MPRTNFFHNTTLRLALAFTGFFVAAMIILGTAIYWFIADELEARLKRDIGADQATLVATLKDSGPQGLTAAINRRIAARTDDQMIYLFMERSGRLIAGNIGELPAFEGWRTFAFEQLTFPTEPADDADNYYLFGATLDAGVLIVGRSVDDVEEQQDIILNTLGWGLAGIALLTSIGAIMVGRRAQSRIDEIGRTLDAVAAGNLDRRITLSGSRDDIDLIATNINHAIEQLSSYVESMRQVSSDIAHELKTPISRLRQKLEVARGPAQRPEDINKAVEEAVRETETIVATFDALLRIAQIEAGARKSRFTSLSLRDLLGDFVEIYQPVAEGQGFQFTAKLPLENSMNILGDSELLNQMFANIVENAIVHCPAGSVIGLELERTEGTATVSITDNGPGIPENDRDKVFRRLYRVEKSRTTSGSGLGLSLVAAIADLHDAEIHLADNKPGLAVKFSFNLLS